MDTYRDWLEERDYKVSPEEYASHKHLVTLSIPLLKELRRLAHDFGGHYSFPTSKFNPHEQKVLEEAIRIIDNAAIPVAMLKVEQPPPPVILASDDPLAAKVAKRYRKP
jgi:hypothetical protein